PIECALKGTLKSLLTAIASLVAAVLAPRRKPSGCSTISRKSSSSRSHITTVARTVDGHTTRSRCTTSPRLTMSDPVHTPRWNTLWTTRRGGQREHYLSVKPQDSKGH